MMACLPDRQVDVYVAGQTNKHIRTDQRKTDRQVQTDTQTGRHVIRYLGRQAENKLHDNTRRRQTDGLTDGQTERLSNKRTY